MVRQAHVNGSAAEPGNAVARNAFEFVADVVTLGELQWKLLALDIRRASRKSLAALVVVSIGMGLAGSSITLLLAALGVALSQVLPLWGALLAAGLAGLVVGGGLLAFAAQSLRAQSVALDRSRSEFTNNITWLKAALRGGSTNFKETS
jgi:hypothetical protein